MVAPDLVTAGAEDVFGDILGRVFEAGNAWRITDTWVGIGFGLERLLMTAEGGSNLSRFGRSISYLDGIRLNI